jgi:hypothetical protein
LFNWLQLFYTLLNGNVADLPLKASPFQILSSVEHQLAETPLMHVE